MEELDFFEEICLNSLYATKAVKFAAVVDSDGKVVTGKFKKIYGFDGSATNENSFNADRKKLLVLSSLFNSSTKQ